MWMVGTLSTNFLVHTHPIDMQQNMSSFAHAFLPAPLLIIQFLMTHRY